MLLDLFRPEAGPNADSELAQSPEVLRGEWLAVLGSIEAGAPEVEIPAKPARELGIPLRERPRKAAREFEHQIILAQQALPVAVAEPRPLTIEITIAPATENGQREEPSTEAEGRYFAPDLACDVEKPMVAPVAATEIQAAEEAAPEAEGGPEEAVRDDRTEEAEERPERLSAGPSAPSPALAECTSRATPAPHPSEMMPVREDRPSVPRPPKREEERRALPTRAPVERAKPAEEPVRQTTPVLGLRIWQGPELEKKPSISPQSQAEPAESPASVRSEADPEVRRGNPPEVTPKRLSEPKIAAVEPIKERQGERLAKVTHQDEAEAPPAKFTKPETPEAPTVERGSGPVMGQPKVEAVVQVAAPIKPVRVDIPQPAPAERPAAPRAIEERNQAPSSQPVIRVKLDVPEAEPVHVQFVHRAGEVHVLVRSNEPGASTQLASRIDELTHELRTSGAEAEPWAGNEEAQETQREDATRQTGAPDRNTAEARDQSAGERRSQRQLPEWLELLAEREDEAALRRFRRLNEKEESV